MFRLDLLDATHGATPARSEACWRAIDAVGERVGRDTVLAPDELTAQLAACPPADVAAAEAIFAEREDALVRGPTTHDELEWVQSTIASCPECGGDVVIACQRRLRPRVLARWEWQFVLDDTSGPWLHAQRCCAVLVPRRTAALVLEQARKWAAAGKRERIADCLEHCALAPATRTELERLVR